MLFAHILHDKLGYLVVYSMDYKITKFGDKELVDTLFEETSDLVLLDKIIVKWKEAHGIENLRGFQNLSGVSVEPSPGDIIERLRKEIHRLSKMLEEEQLVRQEMESNLRRMQAVIFELNTTVEFQNDDIRTLELELQRSDGDGEDCGEHPARTDIRKITWH